MCYNAIVENYGNFATIHEPLIRSNQVLEMVAKFILCLPKLFCLHLSVKFWDEVCQSYSYIMPKSYNQ